MDDILLRRLSNCIRVLTVDAVENAKSGHPGMPMGMADVMTVLAFEFLKFNPSFPKHVKRDRLVLSAGHGSMLLYAFYYLAGYRNFTLEDIKSFRQLDSKTPGHPEYGSYEAIETSTGPLGQGLGVAVGMAIAAKKREANYKIYSIVGDGCLMEGLGYEALSIAGHLSLNNLIILFDSNKITIDGPTSLAISENHIAKFLALGFEVENIDGHNFQEIRFALNRANKSKKPFVIICNTMIAMGSPNKSGSEKSHGSPLGAAEVELFKDAINWSKEAFYIPEDLLAEWRNIERLESDNGALPTNQIQKSTNYNIPDIAQSTRVSSGIILQSFMSCNSSIIAGSADLSFSNNVKHDQCKSLVKGMYDANFIHYGTREAVMSAVMNGLAHEGYISVGGTFLVFSDYMRNGIRLACLMQLKVIYVFTHDSIGVGEDGPTHQPIEHLASLRAIPGITVCRPADFTETLQSWDIAFANNGPTALILTRQNVSQITKGKANVSLGAYILSDHLNPNVTIFASGSEVEIAMKVKNLLDNKLNVRVISIPSFEIFFKQNEDYIASLLDGDDLKVGIEAASSFGWAKIIGRNGLFYGIDKFGKSAPASKLYEYYELVPEKVANKIYSRLSSQI